MQPRIWLATGTVLGLATCMGAGASAQVQPPNPPFLSYAAKFVCGTQRADVGAVRGVYATAINIHNPQALTRVSFFKKAVLALPERSTTQGAISPFKVETLVPDGAMSVDCTDIKLLLTGTALPAYFEGFVVIEVPASTAGKPNLVLDVVGKYTARHENTAGPDQTLSDANSIAVVPVTPQLIVQ